METLKSKRRLSTSGYRFSFINCQNTTLFWYIKITKEYIYITLQCVLGGHNDRSRKIFGGHKQCYDGQRL